MRIKVLSGGRKNIELSLSDAELNFQMRRIGIEETVPMCRLVEVSEKDNPLHRFEGQTVNMDEVNFFAKRMESLTEYERKVLSAYAEDYGVATMKDLINLTFSMKGLSLLTDFSDARQVGVRLYMDEFLGMSEEEKEQTNFIEFAEKTLKESRVEVLPYGVFVEHGFEMLEVYNGKTFPAFVASEETVAVVEVQNKTGDTEYLYLPTDICSMNKVKERLQVQDYWEMEVIEIENLRLPDILVPTTEDLREVEQLTLFNEMCHAVKRFDEVKMNQLAMVVEFTGLCDFPDVAYIATHLGEFEINPLVHNDEEYGKFLVTESGLFDVDELLLPHINYAYREWKNRMYKAVDIMGKEYNALVRINLYRPTEGINEFTKQFILSPEKLLNILYWIDRNHHILSISDALLSNLVTNSFEEDPSGIDSIRILPDGSITPSTYLIEKNFIVGNILEKEVMKRLTKEMPMRAIIFDCIPEECKHCKYVQLCKGGVYDRRYIWNKTLSKKDPYCIYTPGGEDFNKIEITDAKFNSVHHGYLPTMFFEP